MPIRAGDTLLGLSLPSCSVFWQTASMEAEIDCRFQSNRAGRNTNGRSLPLLKYEEAQRQTTKTKSGARTLALELLLIDGR